MTERQKLRTIVVGNGLIGSAAGRYLAEAGSAVTIIGPGEPADPETHSGVFASHYDQGRLCTNASRDPIWQLIGAKAIENYPSLEAAAGIRFHRGVGWLRATRLSDDQRESTDRWIDQLRRSSGINVERFGPEDRSWGDRFPMLVFPDGYDLVLEPGPAGYVNPRQMLAAQNAVAIKHGATVIPNRAVALDCSADGVTVRTEDGAGHTADRVLVACGAFTNFDGLLPVPLPLRVKTETTVWGTVSAETAAALEGMPSVGYDIDDPDIDDIYMAPPIRYPDGMFKIKMGCNSAGEQWPERLEEVQAWFQSGASDDDLPSMERALRTLLPTVDFIDVTSHRCIVTYTPSGYPTIDAAPGDQTGRLFVAAGGNGTSAQGSDTLGRLAAELVLDGTWTDDLPRQPFLATNQWDSNTDTETATDGQGTRRLSKAQARAARKC
jgi:sarcosine oxidase